MQTLFGTTTPENPARSLRYLQHVSKELNIRSIEDWYNVSRSEIIDKGGRSILKQHNESVYDLLQSTFPEYEWLPWKFGKVPQSFWSRISNQRRYFDWLQQELALRFPDDLYTLRQHTINNNGGRGLLAEYRNSLSHAITTIYLDYEWLPWRFATVPCGYWDDHDNQRLFLEWLAQEEKIENPHCWTWISRECVIDRGGSGLMEKYASVWKALLVLYEEYRWKPWIFKQNSRYWEDLDNQRYFLEYLGHLLGVETMDQWHTVKAIDLLRVDGEAQMLLNMYEHSMIKMLSALYPAEEWKPWRFGHVPSKYWDRVENQRKFLNWFADQFRIQEPAQWYTVRHVDIIQAGGSTLLEIHNSLYHLLYFAFPELLWQPWRFVGGNSPSIWTLRLQEEYLEWLAVQLELKHPEMWYHVLQKRIQDNFGAELLELYDSSVRMLFHVYPEYKWHHSTLFDRNYWEDLDAQLLFMERMAQELQILFPEQWYNIDISTLCNRGGGVLMTAYHNSIYDLMAVLFPEYSWQPWQFLALPSGFWSSLEHQTVYFNWLSTQLNIKELTQWYEVKKENLFQHRVARSILQYYDNSLYTALNNMYTNFPWEPWKFKYWDCSTIAWESSNQEKYIDYLANKLQVQTPEQWNQVSTTSIEQHGGINLLERYNSSIYQALNDLYPDYPWQPCFFDSAHHTFWDDATNRRLFMDWLGKKLGLVKKEMWYQVSKEDIVKRGGIGLLAKYGNLVSRLVSEVYNELDWQPWLFKAVPPGYWKKRENMNKYTKWLGAQLGLVTPNDVYHVSIEEVLSLKGAVPLKKFGGLFPLLAKCSNISWDQWKEKQTKIKTQKLLMRRLEYALGNGFDRGEFQLNFKHPQINFAGSQKCMELDIYLPSHRLAFEYQGAQHYKTKGASPIQIEHDAEKVEACIRENITLIHVPFWWDRKLESLLATIRQWRADVIMQH